MKSVSPVVHCSTCNSELELRITQYGSSLRLAIEQLREELDAEEARTPPNPESIIWFERTLGLLAQERQKELHGEEARPVPLFISLVRCTPPAQGATATPAPAGANPIIEEAVKLLRMLQPQDLVRFALDGQDAIPDMPEGFRAGIIPLASRLKSIADGMPAGAAAPPADPDGLPYADEVPGAKPGVAPAAAAASEEPDDPDRPRYADEIPGAQPGASAPAAAPSEPSAASPETPSTPAPAAGI